MGRPSDYKEEYNELAYNFCLLGATDRQMARSFDIDERTLNRWKKKYPKFCQSLNEGKTPADSNVAKSLYKRACGYRYTEVTVAKDPSKSKVVTKEALPDTAACMIWLKNRADWKDSREGGGLGENAAEHFKAIADAIKKSDTDPA